MQMNSSSLLQHSLSVHKPCLLVHLPSHIVALCFVITNELLQQDRMSSPAAIAANACIT